MSAGAFIFHVNIPCDKTFPWVPLFFTLWPLKFDPFLENFNIAYNFWTVSARVLMLYMGIPCDKTFAWVPFFFTLFPSPLSLTHFLNFENFNLSNNFWQWVLVLWYFTWIFPVIRPVHGYYYVLPCDLYLGVWPIFRKL